MLISTANLLHFCSRHSVELQRYCSIYCLCSIYCNSIREYLVLMAFSSEGSFTCHTYCDMGPPFLRSYPEDQWFYLVNAVLLAKEQSLQISNVLDLKRPAQTGELTTCHLLSESTTTRLRQPAGTTDNYMYWCSDCRWHMISDRWEWNDATNRFHVQ
jgi:hypothetical protein